MNTDARELTDEELNAREGLNEDFDENYRMKLVQYDGNGSFSTLKNAVFTALVLGMGVTVFIQQQTNATFAAEIAVLKLECRNMASARIP